MKNTSVNCAVAVLLVACGGGGSDQASFQVATAHGPLDVSATLDVRAKAEAAPEVDLSAARTGASAQRYSFTDLGTPVGPYRGSWASGINNAGQVVGASQKVGEDSTHATIWNGTSAVDLSKPDWTFSSANGINDAGQVAGSGIFGGAWHAISWSGTNVIDLTPPNRTDSYANGINNAGQVVGVSHTSSHWRVSVPACIGSRPR